MMYMQRHPSFSERAYFAMDELELNGLIYLHDSKDADLDSHKWQTELLLEACQALQDNDATFIPIIASTHEESNSSTIKPLTELLSSVETGFWFFSGENQVGQRYLGPTDHPSDLNQDMLMYWAV